MRVTVCLDNQTTIDIYYLGEAGVSYWLEADGKQFLFDAGYSDAYLKNIDAMGFSLSELDGLILSHGHNDHTGGLPFLLEAMEAQKASLNIIAHPNVFAERREDGLAIGSPIPEDEMRKRAQLRLSKQPQWLTENLVFLGEIPRVTAFESKHPIGEAVIDGALVPDYILDDSAVAYRTSEGVYIVTGCSHAGICNIAEYAKKVTGKERVLGILGGFHLFELDERTSQTVDYLVQEDIPELYPCHCTGFYVRSALHQKSPIGDVGVGLVLDWD